LFFVLKVLLYSVYSVFVPNGHGEVSERRKTRSEASGQKETPEWQIELGITQQAAEGPSYGFGQAEARLTSHKAQIQSLPPRRSGRCIQRAIRADDNVSMRLCTVGTQTPMSVSPSEEFVDFCCATHGVYAAECLAMPYERAASARLPDTERAASALRDR